MTSVLAAAIGNNVHWCDAVCRSGGVRTRWRAVAWVTLDAAPPFYPDAITLRSGATADDVHDLSPRSGCSVKDSYACIDLATVGFAVLFDAQWVFADPGAAAAQAGPRWRIVRTPLHLQAWSAAHGSSGTFGPALLADARIRFVSIEHDGQITGGLALCHTDSVVGISNVFGRDRESTPTWPQVAAVTAALFPSTPMVGYQRDGDLGAALRSGWQPIGPLRVWARTATS